jgi:peptidoglycan/LPS O-acetylase OafA/YrhL
MALRETGEPGPLSGPGTLPSRLNSLTGLRWWAVLLVFGKHILTATSGGCPEPPDSKPVLCTIVEKGFDQGFIGVTCFFVLSGFVLTWTMRRSDTKRRFYQRRFAKIYPLFLLGFVVDFVIRWLTAADEISILSEVLSFFLVHTWYPDGMIAINAYSVSWSLSCEVLFYLCFPFIYGWLNRLGNKALWMLSGALLLWPAVPVLGVAIVDSSVLSDPYSFFLPALLYFWPVSHLSDFVIGVVAALLVQRGAWRGFPVVVTLPVAVACYLAVNPILPYLGAFVPLMAPAMVPALVLLVVSLARADITGTWSPMRGRLTVLLGTISYAFYLFHAFFVQNMKKLFSYDSSGSILLFIAAMLALATATAYVLYRWVEVPTHRALSPRPLSSSGSSTLPAGTSH